MIRSWSRSVALAVVIEVIGIALSDFADVSYRPEQNENETQHGDSARRFLQSCDKAQLQARMQEVEQVCCDELEEECSSGFPTRCNPGCSALFLPVRSSRYVNSSRAALTTCVCDNSYVPSAQVLSRMTLRCCSQSLTGSKRSVRSPRR